MKINLGCGSLHLAGWVNVDISKNVGADVVHNLDMWPWPFFDGAADEIEARDVFEHVADPILFMTECHRILGTLGTLIIQTPHWRHQDAFTDPTHRRFPTEHTFDYWIKGTVLYQNHNRAYGDVTYHLQQHEYVGGSQRFVLRRL